MDENLKAALAAIVKRVTGCSQDAAMKVVDEIANELFARELDISAY